VIDPHRFAGLLCDWCLEVAEGQQVVVRASPLADALVRALHSELLDRGVWPLLRIAPAWLSDDFYRHAGEAALDGFAPLELIEAESVDAQIRINAPANTRALSGVDARLITRATAARRPIQRARLARRWCGTIWPTPALAQQAGMSEIDYEEFLGRALFLDRPEPVSGWSELSARQARIVERLASAGEIRIEAEHTDLTLRVDGRTWINSDGRRNMPSGEVFTGPLETSASGAIAFAVASSPAGVEVSGVKLRFADGEVVQASAERGQDYLDAALATDPGARFLGELGIGTNAGIDRATGSTLLDEKIAGTVHLALGSSYPETGGENVSALHWDLICDLRGGGRLSVDGETVNDFLWSVG
jgi:aminopeptidase